ncbi:MAG TPA: hypothetical protein VF701_09235 [Thermoanaerobaculia bacterium]
MKRIVMIIGIGVCLAGCGGKTSEGRATTSDEVVATPARAVTSPAKTDSSFTATLGGALDRELAGDALAGSKYNRYHINMASRGAEPGDVTV